MRLGEKKQQISPNVDSLKNRIFFRLTKQLKACSLGEANRPKMGCFG